ncbi:MAG: molybdate ABC transporter substrate-binding protein [Candidatus Sedimenticola endophacoides]
MNFKLISVFIFSVFIFSQPVSADVVRVAVAANFSAPMKALVKEFRQQTGHRVQPVFGSSGKLYAQIMNGAPYQVFLSADTAKPDKLIQQARADSSTRFTYARGALVLWSADESQAQIEPGLIRKAAFRHLALANARLAPYGRAAKEALRNLELWEPLKSKVVTGENISQTYQFVASGNAEFGFIALSQVAEKGRIKKGSGWIVPQDYHTPILQDAVLLNRGKHNPAALALIDFLQSESAKDLIESYGYLM